MYPLGSPFFSENLAANYSKTIGLWFGNFEFNAGIYNLVKHIGITYFDAKQWILIKTWGTLVKIFIVVLIIGIVAFKNLKNTKTLLSTMLVVLTLYYLLSATVHPWYVVFLLGLSIFTEYKFVIAWSALITLSYFAYGQPDFSENLWLIALEYVVVITLFTKELWKNHNILSLIRKKP